MIIYVYVHAASIMYHVASVSKYCECSALCMFDISHSLSPCNDLQVVSTRARLPCQEVISNWQMSHAPGVTVREAM